MRKIINNKAESLKVISVLNREPRKYSNLFFKPFKVCRSSQFIFSYIEKWNMARQYIFTEKEKNQLIQEWSGKNDPYSTCSVIFSSLNTIRFWGNFDKSSASRTTTKTTKYFLRSLTHYLLAIKNNKITVQVLPDIKKQYQKLDKTSNSSHLS